MKSSSITKQIDDLEESVRITQSSCSLSDYEMSRMGSKISSLILSIHNSLKSEVNKLAKARQNIEASQCALENDDNLSFDGKSNSVLSDTRSIGESIITTSTQNLSTLVGEWIQDWENGSSATQHSLERLKNLLKNLNLDEDYLKLTLDTSIDESDDDSSDSIFESDASDIESIEHVVNVPDVLTPKSTAEEREEDENENNNSSLLESIMPSSRILSMSPTMNNLLSSLDIIMNGVVSAISRTIRMVSNFFNASFECKRRDGMLKFNELLFTDPFVNDPYFDFDQCHRSVDYLDFTQSARLCQFFPSYEIKSENMLM
ncbi:rRNA-processing protein [Acrasis kona]|uniref:rRNA-processing protein n=1 Tax=Acrasis kona TaxID=1008807 RepID=A0AAW2YZT9_9EUKA